MSAATSELQNGELAENDNESENQSKEHLVVMVHGLFGSDKHLVNVVKVMRESFAISEGDDSILVYVSKVNKRTKTLDGINECGSRLVEELKECIGKHKTLKTISFVGHSMGGLISRYAIGHAYDSSSAGSSKTIFGLQPLHFITICTPHFGCNDSYMKDIKKEDSVTPCLRWAGAIPVIGKVPAFLFEVFESFFVGLVLRRTGKQLFLRDKNPVIVQMATDGNTEIQFSKAASTKTKITKSQKKSLDRNKTLADKVPYLSALAAFAERTAYGNIRGDHVVAWENATVRRKCDLPKISRKEAPYGIVNVEEASQSSPPEGSEPLSLDDDDLSLDDDAAAPSLAKNKSLATCHKVEVMIKNLEALGWRRVDVKTKILIHKNAPWAHDNIISKKDAHDNFKVVAQHSSELLVRSIKEYEARANSV